MIQATGKIKVANAKQSVAVQKALFAKGYGWYKSLEKELANTDANSLTWGEWEYEPKRIFIFTYQTRLDDDRVPVHTLSDFNLDEDGNELPLLKVGQKVTVSKELLADVCMRDTATIDSVFTIFALGSENDRPFGGSAKFFYLFPNGRAYHGQNGQKESGMRFIGTVIPVATEQPAPKPLTPGSQAIDTKNRTCQILAIAEGFALCKYKEEPTQKHPVRAVELGKLRTKPEPVTVSLNCEYTATLDTDGATVGCQHISPEAMDEVVAAWRKIRKA